MIHKTHKIITQSPDKALDTITNTTSYADNPDVAVSVVTVVEDIYQNNLTTKQEAATIVDDVITNIRDNSGILDIVINVNGSQNISWVVLDGSDIETELSTISAITSNEGIIDVGVIYTSHPAYNALKGYGTFNNAKKKELLERFTDRTGPAKDIFPTWMLDHDSEASKLL